MNESRYISKCRFTSGILASVTQYKLFETEEEVMEFLLKDRAGFKCGLCNFVSYRMEVTNHLLRRHLVPQVGYRCLAMMRVILLHVIIHK